MTFFQVGQVIPWRSIMPGTCNVICSTPAGDLAFISGGEIFSVSCTRLQADSQQAEAASTHVTPIRPNIGRLVNPRRSDHPLPIVSCHVQKTIMNTRADHAITTVARVRMPLT
jgi:hypothetical protein